MTPQPRPFCRIRFWLSLFALAGAVASAPLLASGPGTLQFDQASLDDGDNGPGGDDDRDHPAGKLRFDDARFEVVEGETVAVIRVERSGGETGAVAVSFATSDGSAVAGLDYESAQGTLSWPAGSSIPTTPRS